MSPAIARKDGGLSPAEDYLRTVRALEAARAINEQTIALLEARLREEEKAREAALALLGLLKAARAAKRGDATP